MSPRRCSSKCGAGRPSRAAIAATSCRSDAAGRVERGIGDPHVLVNLRSSVKPFALIALVESGAVEAFQLSDPELAVMAASHTGEDAHVRTLQAVFRRSNLSQSLLACGSEGAPQDALTAARLARDGEEPGPIRHMCSGFHTASLLLSRHMGWSLADYWRPEHPSQVAVREAVAGVFGVATERVAHVGRFVRRLHLCLSAGRHRPRLRHSGRTGRTL